MELPTITANLPVSKRSFPSKSKYDKSSELSSKSVIFVSLERKDIFYNTRRHRQTKK